MRDIAQDTRVPMSRSEVASLVSQAVGDSTREFKAEFAASMADSFNEINLLLEDV